MLHLGQNMRIFSPRYDFCVHFFLGLIDHLTLYNNVRNAPSPSYAQTTKNGCFAGDLQNLVECGKNGGHETPLPDSFKPLIMTEEMDNNWIELLRDNVIYSQP